jgi:hypothetical protein
VKPNLQGANTGRIDWKTQFSSSKIEDGKFLTPKQRIDFQRLAGKYLEARMG